jgi:uncharacterized protein (TIGR03067 family)
MPRRLVLIFVAASLGFAPAPFQKTERRRKAEDLTDVAGSWQILSWEFNGKKQPGTERLLEIRMTRERFAFFEKKTGHQDVYVMKLDPAASPPAFSLSVGKRIEMVGSYRLRRDELIMIFDEDESLQRRPTDFSGKVAYRVELKRIRRD